MPERLTTTQIEDALAEVGRRLDWQGEVKLLLVGGAAAMITGLLPPSRTTYDCDVMRYDPTAAWGRVELIAEEVGREREMPPNWLNSNVQIRADSLPDGWESRAILIGHYGCLRVSAASRLDLIAMKFLAHRAVDLEDLRDMKVTADEVTFTRQFLDRIEQAGSNLQEIEEAREYLNAWELS